MVFPPMRKKAVPEKPKKKCKLVIKKQKDGTVIKSIEGECTKEQLRALSNQDETELKD